MENFNNDFAKLLAMLNGLAVGPVFLRLSLSCKQALPPLASLGLLLFQRADLYLPVCFCSLMFQPDAVGNDPVKEFKKVESRRPTRLLWRQTYLVV